MSTSFQSIISQATDAVKGFLGMDNLSQSSVKHDKPYLKVIANGNWKRLRPAVTRETCIPVVGFPANYTWPTRKIKTNFIRYPFLSQIRQPNRSLRPAKTIDRSLLVIDKNYKMRPASNRKQLLSDIRSFKLVNLKPIPKPSLLSQAKVAVSSAYVGVKEALGINYWPQSQARHERAFLDDVVKGDWKLKRASTQVTQMPVVGFPAGFNLYSGMKFNTKAPTRPLYLEQIRNSQWKLNRIQPLPNKSLRLNFQNWRMSKPADRRQLMLSIRKFDQSSLKRAQPLVPVSDLMNKAKSYASDKVDTMKEMIGMETYPQSKTEHTARYLDDIANGSWNSLKHVEEVRERPGVVGGDWKMKKGVDRSVLLEEVKEGCDLKHVDTVEKVKPVVEEGYKVKKGEERKTLLNDIRGFENESLHHIGSS